MSYHKYPIIWKRTKKLVISMVFQQIIAVLSFAFSSKIFFLCLMIAKTLLSLCHKIYVTKFCVTCTVSGHLLSLAFSRLIAMFWKGFGGLNSLDMLKHLFLRVKFVKRQKPVVNFMVKWKYDRGPVVHLNLFELTLLGSTNYSMWASTYLSHQRSIQQISKCYPLKDRTVQTTCKYFLDYCLMFGILLELYSDRDPAFEVELFQLLMQEFGVKTLCIWISTPSQTPDRTE